MENSATGLVEHLRRQHAAGRPMPQFALLHGQTTTEAIYTTLKAMLQQEKRPTEYGDY